MAQTPDCYGNWDPVDVACHGGRDPTYQNPETGSHVRPRCPYFMPCKAHTDQQRLISASSLLRNQAVQPPTEEKKYPFYNPPPQYAPQRPPQPAPMVQQQPPYMQPQRPPQQAPPQQYYQQPPQMQMSPIQMMPVNYAMPGYLSQQEEGTFLGAIGRTLLRASIKGAAHALAHFVDQVPLGVPDPKE